MGEDHALRVPLRAEAGQDLDPPGRGQELLEPEAVHPDGAAALHEAAEVAEVVAVAAVADDDAAEVHAFLGEDGLLRLPGAAGGPGVGRDRHARGLLGARAGAQDGLDHRRHAGGVGGALDDGCLHAALADTLGDVPDEERGHLVDAVAGKVALGHPPDPGGHDHPHRGPPRHLHDEVEVASEVHGGEIHDGADAAGVEVGQLPFGQGQDAGAIPEVRPVLLHAGRAGDDVLVHQGGAELGRRERARRGLDLGGGHGGT